MDYKAALDDIAKSVMLIPAMWKNQNGDENADWIGWGDEFAILLCANVCTHINAQSRQDPASNQGWPTMSWAPQIKSAGISRQQQARDGGGLVHYHPGRGWEA